MRPAGGDRYYSSTQGTCPRLGCPFVDRCRGSRSSSSLCKSYLGHRHSICYLCIILGRHLVCPVRATERTTGYEQVFRPQDPGAVTDATDC